MRRLLVVLSLVFPGIALAQEEAAPPQYDPSRITPEIRKKTETIAKALEGLTPQGFTRKGHIERYSDLNLYEKINGRSEIFHAYDVAGMACATLTQASDPGKFIDIYIYDMSTPLGAFGISSVERAAGSRTVSIGDGGHRTDADLFFRKGRYYATILTSGPDADVQRAATSLAETLANRLKGEAAEIWGLEMLPAKDRRNDTIQYIMVDALGLDFLANAFLASYRSDAGEFTAFLARSETPEQAALVLSKYAAYLGEFGKSAEPVEIAGSRVILADVGGGSFDAACRVGSFVVGVTSARGRDAAVKAMTFVLEGSKLPK
ncbi:MAG: DUF6599 family protein [Isosphaeraceae bacterium]|nr:DUF6599 family protein [Isosphaeraceae bacterium]